MKNGPAELPRARSLHPLPQSSIERAPASRHFYIRLLILWKRGDVIWSAHRELMSVLIGHLFSHELISKATYSKAEDLVYSVMDLPELLQYPVCLKEAGRHECAENPQ